MAKGWTVVRMIMVFLFYVLSPPLMCSLCIASIRGGRRLAVRTAMEHPIGALPRTPFPASRDFAPVGSMSLDSRVAGLPYESSSFATSRGNEKIGGTGYCVTYDTDSQSRNADFISIAAERQSTALGLKGHQTYEPSGP